MKGSFTKRGKTAEEAVTPDFRSGFPSGQVKSVEKQCLFLPGVSNLRPTG